MTVFIRFFFIGYKILHYTYIAKVYIKNKSLCYQYVIFRLILPVKNILLYLIN